MTKGQTQPTAAGRPIDEAKRRKIMAATEALISHHGIKGTSMEAIAREAGVSKVTVYNRFGDLVGLAEETASADAKAMQTVVQDLLNGDAPLETRLTQLGRVLISRDGQNRLRALERLIYDLSTSQHDVSERVFRKVLQPLADVIEDAMAKELPEIARERTWAYLAMLRGGEQYAVSLGVEPPMTEEAFEKHLRFVVRWALADPQGGTLT